jgi:hypothetical protein
MQFIPRFHGVAGVLVFFLVISAVFRGSHGAQEPVQSHAAVSHDSSALEVLSVFDRFLRRHVISLAHPLTDLPDEPEDVEYAYRLLQTNETSSVSTAGRETEPSVQLAAGDVLSALITLSRTQSTEPHGQWNTSDDAYRVVGAMGALHAVHNPTLHLQNMTFSLVNRTLGRDQELSFVYPLAVHAAFPPGPCILRLTVFLERVWNHKDLLEHLGIPAEQVAALLSGPSNASMAAFLERKSNLGYAFRVLDGLVEIKPAVSGREYRLLFTILAIVASSLVVLVAVVSSVDTPSTRKISQWLQRQCRNRWGSTAQASRRGPTSATPTDAATTTADEWLLEHRQMMRGLVGTGSKGAVRVARAQ